MQRKNIQEQLLTTSELPVFKEYCDILSGSNPNRKDYKQCWMTQKQAVSHI